MDNSILDQSFLERYYSDEIIQQLRNLQDKKKNIYTDKVRIKSVQGPIAQTAGLCESRKMLELREIVLQMLSDENKEISKFEKAVTELMFMFGLRISEVLSILPNDVNNNGSINIKGKKGSNSRIVYPIKYRELWLSMKASGWTIPSSYNRYHFYRLFKKKGLYEIFSNNEKKSVTHVLRYHYIAEMLSNNLEIEQIKLNIGHKSIKSTKHYVDNLR